MTSTPSQIGADVARTMTRMVDALESSSKEALRDIGKQARTTMLKAATIVPGSDRRFSNMRRYNHGGRLAVTMRVRRDLAFVGSKGPWKVAELGAAPHRVNHPGTARSQGRRAWSRAADPIVSRAEVEVPQVIGDAVEEAFGG